jgi:hypothetical protein
MNLLTMARESERRGSGSSHALEAAPLVGARSCRYELTPDTRLIAASHPDHLNVWLVGGGSGHGFKLGRRWLSGSQPQSRAERRSRPTLDSASARARAACGRRAQALRPLTDPGNSA